MEQQKIERLSRYVKIWEDLPEQGTDAWLKKRTYSVGGSEMSKIDSTSYAIRTLILNKINVDRVSLNKCMPVFWGWLLEPLIRIHAEHKYNCEIKELGSVKGKYGSSYSLDGIGVVERTVMGVKVHQIALFEFKCPWSRILEGKVPSYYQKQVQTGLTVIGPTEFAIYGEMLIRSCALDQLGPNPEINTILHHAERNNLQTPEWYGIILFHLEKKNEDIERVLNRLLEFREMLFDADVYETNVNLNLVDLGCDNCLEYLLNLPRNAFSYEIKILSKQKGEKIDMEALYDDLLLYAPTSTNFEEGDYFAFMPWKLFRVDYTHIERDPNFIEDRRDKLVELMQTVRSAKKIKEEKGVEAARVFVSNVEFKHLPNHAKPIRHRTSGPNPDAIYERS